MGKETGREPRVDLKDVFLCFTGFFFAAVLREVRNEVYLVLALTLQ